MPDFDTKRRIDAARDIFIGMVRLTPNPIEHYAAKRGWFIVGEGG